MENMVEEYDRKLLKIMDKHAPLKERVVNVRTRSPWMTTEIIEEKKRKRKYGRKWRVSKLTEDRGGFKAQKKKYDKLLREDHTKYLSDLISDNSNDSKSLFKLINSIVSNSNDQRTILINSVSSILRAHPEIDVVNNVKLFLYGNDVLSYDDNKRLLLSTIKFIMDSNRS